MGVKPPGKAVDPRSPLVFHLSSSAASRAMRSMRSDSTVRQTSKISTRFSGGARMRERERSSRRCSRRRREGGDEEVE